MLKASQVKSFFGVLAYTHTAFKKHKRKKNSAEQVQLGKKCGFMTFFNKIRFMLKLKSMKLVILLQTRNILELLLALTFLKLSYFCRSYSTFCPWNEFYGSVPILTYISKSRSPKYFDENVMMSEVKLLLQPIFADRHHSRISLPRPHPIMTCEI